MCERNQQLVIIYEARTHHTTQSLLSTKPLPENMEHHFYSQFPKYLLNQLVQVELVMYKYIYHQKTNYRETYMHMRDGVVLREKYLARIKGMVTGN